MVGLPITVNLPLNLCRELPRLQSNNGILCLENSLKRPKQSLYSLIQSGD
ncbi:hypothetical protein [Shigella phage ESh22]|nr:hypothetical protein [Shigella phage ESh21]URY12720.1 hypothetical protein [Shigella phage ESh22]